MTPEFHPAAQEELAAAVNIGDTRAAGLDSSCFSKRSGWLHSYATYQMLANRSTSVIGDFRSGAFLSASSTALMAPASESSLSLTGANVPDTGPVASDI